MTSSCSRGALAALVLGSVACRPPTQVIVVLTTNITCDQLQGTAIIVGTPVDVDTKAPGTITTTCAEGRIGAIALIPGTSRDASFAIKVLTGVGVLADECVTTPTRPTDVKGVRGCVVARRELGFIPETPLTLPIEIHQACIGVVCFPDQTCIEGGKCVSDKITDPLLCAGPAGCDETSLGKGGAGGGSASATSSSGTTSTGTTAASSSGTGSSGTSSSSSGMGGMGGAGTTGPSSASAGGAGTTTGSTSGAGGSAAAGSSSGSSGTGGAPGTSGSSSSSGTGGAPGTSGSSSAGGTGGTGGTGPTGPGSSSSGGTGGTGGTAAAGSSSSSTGSGMTKDAGVSDSGPQDSGVIVADASAG